MEHQAEKRQELLSVIIPVYNMEHYLECCIQSVLSQTYCNLEVILIDDGSTDNSGELCRRYAEADARIKLISQENRGLSAARRRGIEAMTGNYVAFVDADDYIDADYFQQLMDCKGHFDLVIAQWIREDVNKTRRACDSFALGAYDTPEDIDFLLRHLINISYPGGTINIKPGVAGYVWNKLFKADIVRSAFQTVKTDIAKVEDRPITYCSILKSKAILFTDICGYHYVIRKNSESHSMEKDWSYLQSFFEYYNIMNPIFSAHPARDVLIPQLQAQIVKEFAKAPDRMGFVTDMKLQLKMPVFPFVNLLEKKRLVLYGANFTSWSYAKQIKMLGQCTVVLWVDKNWQEYVRIGWDISPLESLKDCVYDYIILTSSSQEEADIMCEELVNIEIEDYKLLWKPPLEL